MIAGHTSFDGGCEALKNLIEKILILVLLVLILIGAKLQSELAERLAVLNQRVIDMEASQIAWNKATLEIQRQRNGQASLP